MVKNDRIIRKTELLKMIGVSHPTIWRWERDGKFPKRISLGRNSIGWSQYEVQGWLDDKANKRFSYIHTKTGLK